MNGRPRTLVGSLLVVRRVRIPLVTPGWSTGAGLCLALLSACASPLATSARQDDLPTFQNTLRSAEKPLSDATFVEVARAVAERELLSMPRTSAVARVTELEACIGEFAPTLRELSEREDVVGAVATQVLLDAGLWRGDRKELVERHAASPDPEWRAVAARAAVARDQAALRRQAFLDGDLRVRRAALLAARDARLVEDQEALLEAARLDPDPVARTFAFQALSVLAEPVALARLRDIWPHADERVRREIVFTWGRKDAFSNGGQTQLSWVLATQTGVPRLAAAVVLLQRTAPGETNLDAVAAEGVLVRGFTDGTADEQQFVAQYAPRSKALVQAFVDGLAAADEQQAVSAGSVLIRGTTWRKAANLRLTALLESKTPDVAVQARDALAFVRAPQVKDQLQQRLRSAESNDRIAAASQLLKYHRAGERGLGLEQLLADPDASVRTTVACDVIVQLTR